MSQNQWHGCDWKRVDKINLIGEETTVFTVLFLCLMFDFILLLSIFHLFKEVSRRVKSTAFYFAQLRKESLYADRTNTTFQKAPALY